MKTELGYKIAMLFLWLPAVEQAILRLAYVKEATISLNKPSADDIDSAFRTSADCTHLSLTIGWFMMDQVGLRSK